MPGNCVFVWENLGPTHEDRLAALAKRYPGRIHAIELTATSGTYDWLSQDHAVPTVTLFDRPEKARGLALARAIVSACRRVRARHVYLCHYELWPVLLAAIALRLTGRRVVVMIDSKFDDYRRHIGRELGKALFLAPYHAALTASLRSREYLRFLGFRNRRIELGYDTLSVERIRAQCAVPPAPDGIAHEERDFLVIARLVPKKNLAQALDAYALWRARTGGRRALRILGSGPLEADLRAQAQALGIADGVVFEGFVQTERVSAALGRALCLILPSIEEQYGLVVIEAMAMGVPALVSANAGAVDILIDNGVNGWIVSPDRVAPLAAAMERLDGDSAEWARMARAARDGSMRGDASHFVEAVAALSD